MNPSPTSGNPKPPESPSAARAERTGGYEVYRNCRLDPERNNDGDSFEIRLPDGHTEIFRLYFVDTPESEFKEYRDGRSNHERIRQQPGYFGITSELSVETGRRAKKFVLERLASQPFTLYTVWDSPYDDQRYHAFIELPAGTTTRFLDELLVEQGLCRIYTKGADAPDGTPMQQRKDQLRALERKARDRRAGAWGLR